MKIDIKKLLDGAVRELEVNDSLDKGYLYVSGKKLKLLKPIEISAIIYKADNEIYVQGKIVYEYIDTCDRCLNQYPIKKELELFAEVVNNSTQENESENLTVYLNDNTLDLEDVMINAIILDLPMKSICNEECKGICCKCGKNLNDRQCECEDSDVDPRLAKLKELFE